MSTDTHTVRWTGPGRRFGVVALTMVFAMVTFDIGAQRADQRVELANFDIRLAKDAAATGYMARFANVQAFAGGANVSGAQAAGLARLQSNIGSLEVINSPELGTPE